MTFNVKSLQWLLPAALLFLFSACVDDDGPDPSHEEELITQLTYTLTPVDGGAPVVMTFMDPDGDGGTAPTVTVSGHLTTATTYNGSMELLNTSEVPAEDITEEILDEDDDHQFFFQASGGLDLAVDYSDTDEDGHPVGLQTTAVAGPASSGQLTITLRHEPNKDAAGVADGDLTNAGGETDIEVTFDVSIQ